MGMFSPQRGSHKEVGKGTQKHPKMGTWIVAKENEEPGTVPLSLWPLGRPYSGPGVSPSSRESGDWLTPEREHLASHLPTLPPAGKSQSQALKQGLLLLLTSACSSDPPWLASPVFPGFPEPLSCSMSGLSLSSACAVRSDGDTTFPPLCT